MIDKDVIFRVAQQGAPICNGAVICAEGKDVVAISIDMKSKYCNVDAIIDSYQIAIGADEHSLHLKEGIDIKTPEKYLEALTIVEFPRFKGWEIFCAHIARYTLRVCLIREV